MGGPQGEDMKLRIIPALLLFPLMGAANATAQAQTVAVPGDTVDRPSELRTAQERIVDKPMRPGVAKTIARLPLYPMIGLGRAFKKGMYSVEEHHLIEKQGFAKQWLEDRHMQLLSGGMGEGAGLALGINFFDREFAGSDRLYWEMPLRISTANYQQFETALALSLIPKRRLFLETRARYRSRPREDFYGLGPDSQTSDRTNYRLEDRSWGVALGSEFRNGGRVDFGVNFVNAAVSQGRDPHSPDTASSFPDLAGLESGSALLKYGVTAMIPWLDNPDSPHRGVRLSGHLARVDSRDANPYNFYEYGATGEWYVPVGGPGTLAMRGVGEFRTPRSGGEVPFYALPFLGGSQTLRGFREFRFYDRNALLVNVEYRYKVWRLADLALFVDEGQVARRIADFRLQGFRTGYGVGLRFRGMRGTGFRFDVGHSREGWRFNFLASPEW